MKKKKKKKNAKIHAMVNKFGEGIRKPHTLRNKPKKVKRKKTRSEHSNVLFNKILIN